MELNYFVVPIIIVIVIVLLQQWAFSNREKITESTINRLLAEIDSLRLQLSEEMRRAIEAEHLALHDHLTGLANRLALMLHLEQAFKSANRNSKIIAILFIDLDKFKPVNDLYGYDVGDTVLKTVAERMQKTLRDADIVARLGGDEFVIVLTNGDFSGGISDIAARLEKSVCQPIFAKGQSVAVGMSIGAVIRYPKNKNTIDQVLESAGAAMRLVKKHNVSQPCVTILH